MRMRTERWALIGLLMTAPLATADVVTYRDGNAGYTGTADTYIQANSPTATFDTFNFLVNGTTNTSAGGNSQGLLRFDDIFGAGSGQIALGSTINSATLTLTKLGGFGNVRLYELGIPFAETTSTWNSLSAGVSFPAPAPAVGDPIAGFDVIKLVDSKDFGSGFDVPAPNVRVFNVTSSLAAWAAGGTNNGWALIMSESNPGASASIGASNSGTLTNRPLLTIDYTPVPEPATAMLAMLGAGCMTLRRRRA